MCYSSNYLTWVCVPKGNNNNYYYDERDTHEEKVTTNNKQWFSRNNDEMQVATAKTNKKRPQKTLTEKSYMLLSSQSIVKFKMSTSALVTSMSLVPSSNI